MKRSVSSERKAAARAELVADILDEDPSLSEADIARLSDAEIEALVQRLFK